MECNLFFGLICLVTLRIFALNRTTAEMISNGENNGEFTVLTPDQNGKLELRDAKIFVHAIPKDTLKSFLLSSTSLEWNSSRGSLPLNNLESIDISWSKLNPNSLTFSSSLHTIKLVQPLFINGTLEDLLRTATNVQELTMSSMKEIVNLCQFSSYTLQTIKISSSELICKNISSTEVYIRLNFKNLQLIWTKFQQENYKLLLPKLESIIFASIRFNPNLLVASDELVSVMVNDVTLIKGSLEDWLKPALHLQNLVLTNMGSINICEVHVEALTTLEVRKTNPYCEYGSQELNSTIQMNSLKKFILTDSEVEWNSSRIFSVKSLNELSVQNSSFNPIAILFGRLASVTLKSVSFTDGGVHDVLTRSTHLYSLEIDKMRTSIDICRLPLNTLSKLSIERSPLSCSIVTAFESLKEIPLLHLTLRDIFIESDLLPLESLLKHSIYLSELEIDHSYSVVDICELPSTLLSLNIQHSKLLCSNSTNFVRLANLEALQIGHSEFHPNNFKFGSNLISVKVESTNFFEEKLEEVLSPVTNLGTLELNTVGSPVDICNPVFKNLVNVKLVLVNATCGYPILFKNLKDIHIEQSNLDFDSMSFGAKLLKVNFTRIIIPRTHGYSNVTSADVYRLIFRQSAVDICALPFRPFSAEFEHCQISCSNSESSMKLLHKLGNLRFENVSFQWDTNNTPLHLDSLENFSIVNGELPESIFSFTDKLQSIGLHSSCGNLNSFLKTASNLTSLRIYGSGKVQLDISLLPLKTLAYFHVEETIGLTCSNINIVFEKLKGLYSISLFVHLRNILNSTDFNHTFPFLQRFIDTKEVINPKVLLSLFTVKSLNYMEFAFDFEPQIKSFKFGQVMKIMMSAGALNQTSAIQTDNSTVHRRVRYVTLNKVNGNWKSGAMRRSIIDKGAAKHVKPSETKAFVTAYFVVLYFLIIIGIVGNTLSACVLSRKKMKSSAGLILLSLVFFDSGVILTYLIISFYNFKTFYEYFLRTEIKNFELAETEEYEWTAEQEYIRTFLIYPLNKIFYTGSVYTTILISVERFISVGWPLKSKHLLRPRNTKHALFAVLIISIVLNMTRWFESYEWDWYSPDSEEWNDYYRPRLMRMELYRTIYHGWIWTIFMYIIPFVVIAVTNLYIWKQINLARKDRFKLSVSSRQQRSHGDTEMQALTKMLSCVVVVFVICNIIHISIVFYYFLTHTHFQVSNIEAISGLPLLLNSSVNFIIYMVLGKAFRVEMLAMIPNFCRTLCYRRNVNAQGTQVIQNVQETTL